ncbi:MAG: nucleotidyl transferase AbiEii/AbiGii toxin family protein [bacterium]|nr:nucleotidyl transferase AbiEii/AbiGii toxin family protein [bacterium]
MNEPASILSENQKSILELLSKESDVYEHFYLSGGTALAEYYLHHRLSEDLDFFSEEIFEPQSISVLLKRLQKEAGIQEIRQEQSFNRNLFFLTLVDDEIKTEFTYYPFPRIEKGKRVGALDVDSLLDIAVNKIFTVYQKPRSRDFIDLYCILRKEKEWTIRDLCQKAQLKFEQYLDPIQLGMQFLKASELRDYPRLRIELATVIWVDFFYEEAKKLSNDILE